MLQIFIFAFPGDFQIPQNNVQKNSITPSFLAKYPVFLQQEAETWQHDAPLA